MLHRERDPSLKTYLLQIALEQLGYEPGEADNWWGNKSEAAYQAFLKSQDAVSVVHQVKASTFADPDDVARFKRCKLTGKTDNECFAVGDNGIGFWEDDTTTEGVAMCALHKSHLEERFGDDWKRLAHNAVVIVDHRGLTVGCKVADTGPPIDRIDLNPGACARLRIAADSLVSASWRWA